MGSDIKIEARFFMDIDYDENRNPLLPSLPDSIKSYSEAQELQRKQEPTVTFDFDPIGVADFSLAQGSVPFNVQDPEPIPLGTMTPSQGIVINPLPQITVPGGVNSIDASAVDDAVSKKAPAAFSVPMGGGTVQNDIPSIRPRQKAGTYKDGPNQWGVV
jgi:hypothetical protein